MNSKRRIIGRIIAIAMITILTCAMLCACGGDKLSGKWYYISDASEASYNNFEFKSDNKCINQGVEGGYELDGDDVHVDFFGVTADYTLSEYDGVEVMCRGDKPVWARTLDGAKQLQDKL